MKTLVQNYTFDASAKQVTFTDYNPIVLANVLLITNVTDGIIIYNFADPLKTGTAATNVLTLAFDTTGMDDADKLQIFYDDVAGVTPIVGNVAHDAADSGNPIKTGGKANAAEPAAVSENDRANMSVDLYGNQKIVGNIAHDTADRGAPIKIGAIANAEQPAAVAENDRVNIGADLNGNQRMVGNVAHDTADAGNPVKIGAKANASEPAAVAENDRANIGTDLKGNLRMVGNVAHDAADSGNPVKIGGRATAEDQTTVSGAGDRADISVDLYGNLKNVGNVAHDTADRGNPLKVGAKAVNFDGTAPGTDVAENDRTDMKATPDGRLLVETVHPNYWTLADQETSAQTDKELKAAPGAGLSLYITDIIISNGATAGTVIIEGDGASAKTKLVGPLYLASNGGAVINFKTPIKVAANKNIALTSAKVTTHTVTICGFIAA